MNLDLVFSIFTNHTKTGRGASIDWLGKLSVDELKKLENAIFNMKAAALSGLLTTGNLISAHNENSGGFDHNASGWLVMHLTENLEAMLNLGYLVREEFVRRGLGQQGEELKGVRHEAARRHA